MTPKTFADILLLIGLILIVFSFFGYPAFYILGQIRDDIEEEGILKLYQLILIILLFPFIACYKIGTMTIWKEKNETKNK